MPTLPSGITRTPGLTYDILTVDLSTARTDAEVELTGDRVSVIAINGTLDVKLDEKDNPAIELDKVLRFSVAPAKFKKLYFTNTAQSGKSATIYIGREASFEAIPQRIGAVGILDEDENRVSAWERATDPTIYNVTCTAADTEYSQALPSGTRKFLIKARGGTLKVCFVSGASGTTYIQLADGQSWSEDGLKLTGKTLYFQSPTAGTVAEIVAWT